jgi:hypothetical protein
MSVADLLQLAALRGVRPQERATNTCFSALLCNSGVVRILECPRVVLRATMPRMEIFAAWRFRL